MKEKTYVEDVDRNMYDFRNDEKDAYRIKNGLTEDIVEKISEEKHDPEWMHDFRLNSPSVPVRVPREEFAEEAQKVRELWSLVFGPSEGQEA